MLYFIEEVCDVSGHGEVAGLGFVVLIQGESEVELAISV